MSFLTGSAPKAEFRTAPTILPAQQSILNTLSSILSSAAPYDQGIYSLGTTSLDALEKQASLIPVGESYNQGLLRNAATSTELESLDYAPKTISAERIDAKEGFTKGVVEPLTDDFLERTLPGIAGKYGGAAGGAYSSGSQQARRQAATDLERTLAESGALYALGAAKANQNAVLAADISNQTTDVNAQKAKLAALGLATDVSMMPEKVAGSQMLLSTAAVDPYQKMIAEMIAAVQPGTLQTSAVGTGGSTGILGGLLGSAGSGIGSALGSWLFSDKRLKEDIEEVGAVDGFPLYRFKYKGSPERHLGFMAQDVEKRLPGAVKTVGGAKAVDYTAVLSEVLKEAA